jgi:hypothetical protein
VNYGGLKNGTMVTEELMKVHSKLAESKMILSEMNHDLLWREGFRDEIKKKVEYLKSYLADVDEFLKSESKIG